MEVDGRSLRIRREALGVGFTAEYGVADVRALRVSPAPTDPWRGGLRGWGVGGGVIAFDHGARTVRFFAGIDEAEAKALVEEIAPRLPDGDAVPVARP